MAEAYRNLLMEGPVSLVSLVGDILAVGLSRSPYRHRLTPSHVLPVSTIVIVYLEFFTPFSFWSRGARVEEEVTQSTALDFPQPTEERDPFRSSGQSAPNSPIEILCGL